MAHFAKINSENIVTQVIVVDNNDILNLEFPDSEFVGQEFIQSLGLEGSWLQTSYNDNFRKNYAGINFIYDNILNAFIPPKQFNSWLLNQESCQWEAPIPYPNDGNMYSWDESIIDWVEFTDEAE